MDETIDGGQTSGFPIPRIGILVSGDPVERRAQPCERPHKVDSPLSRCHRGVGDGVVNRTDRGQQLVEQVRILSERRDSSAGVDPTRSHLGKDLFRELCVGERGHSAPHHVLAGEVFGEP